MSKKKNIFEEDEVEEEKIDFDFDKILSTPKSKKQKGKVLNVTATKVFIEYGEGLGTFILFDASKHSNLKKGDPIEF